MLNSNLIQLISKLNLVEFKEFGEYIRSTFFNKNKSVVKLYEYLKNYYPDFSEMNFEKEFVYKKLFPRVEYDDAFMRKLMFNLAKLCEDYLAYKNFANDKFSHYNFLLKELLGRKLRKQFQKKLKLVEEEFKKLRIKDSEYYRMEYQIDVYNTSVIMGESNFVNYKDKPDAYLINRSKSLINYFLIEIIQEYRFLSNYKKMVKFDFDSAFLDELICYLKKNELSLNIPLLSLYFNSLLLIIEKYELYFQKVKNLLLKEMNSLSWEDKYSTLAVLVNFTNDEYHKGNVKYLKERFELQKLILENNLYSIVEGGYFFDVLFKNIVTVGLLMKEIDWTEKFIKEYIDKLSPENINNILNYSNGRLHFAKGDYEKSLEDLSRIASVTHFHYKPSIKSLTLMIYIEKGWIDQAYDLIDTYRHFISNDRMLPDFQKERNMNFIRFCNEILKVKSRDNYGKVNDVKFELLHAENVLEKEWLMEKVKEMEIEFNSYH